ncbi:POT family-domain-containing protein [Halteromyces radiatus]|uniref:POT family-domain-containing protein n=1 Tax=Halteromyces radiatus TaxID=101107 RepID=UPI00221F5E3F|nr:POT family-domain-containing protein [Halteromyces radiatus]KAI8081284.1 POT family-domain-containing protein [Halteromyces radiatus]
MLGAIVADQYVGRYYTIIIFSIVYIIGWVILTCTSIPSAIEAGAGFPGYIVALIVVGFGTGGIKGIVSPLCADQYKYDHDYIKELKTGEKVVVDYSLSIQRLYNWFYWAINIGGLVGGVVCPLLELNVDFWAAYLLPTIMLVLCLSVFIAGSKFYYKPRPTGSIILKAFSVIRQAWRQKNLPGNREARRVCKDFMDFAKRDSGLPGVVEWDAEMNEKAEQWDDQFVDELKQAIMACKIFVPLSIYWVTYNNLSNNLISQAAVMAKPSTLPNNIMNNFDPIALLIFVPFVDLVLYPYLRRKKINIFPQQRITLGFFIGSIAMVYAAVVQHYIYIDPLFIETGESSNVSVFIQIPCYVLIAFSEIFAVITSMEYAYTHAPKSMKSVVSALSLWPNCVSALISLAISPAAHDPNMVWVYTGVACGAFACGILYYILFRHYDDIDEEFRLAKLAKSSEPAVATTVDSTSEKKALE